MVLSPDDYLIGPDGTYAWSEARVKAAWKRTLAEVEAALPTHATLILLVGYPASGKSTWMRHRHVEGAVCVDATFVSRKRRAPFLALGVEYGKPVHAVHFTTPFAECLRRNALRTPDRSVPLRAMTRMRDAFETPFPSEGFASVTEVAPS